MLCSLLVGCRNRLAGTLAAWHSTCGGFVCLCVFVDMQCVEGWRVFPRLWFEALCLWHASCTHMVQSCRVNCQCMRLGLAACKKKM